MRTTPKHTIGVRLSENKLVGLTLAATQSRLKTCPYIRALGVMLKWLRSHKPIVAACVILLLALLSLLVIVRTTSAQGSVMHPTITLLDADGKRVIETGNPVSTMTTCGECHDTTFIAEHNAHADVLTGALVAPSGEAVLVDASTGEVTLLDEALEVEANCFLCHTTDPNDAARLDALASGDAAWANTATLLGTGIVEQAAHGYEWNPDAFDETGALLPDVLGIHDPTVDNCGQCHGTATTDAVTPLVMDTCSAANRTTFTTGQVFAPGRISDSGMNIAGKDELARTWDVHSERVVACTDCHYSLNNPAFGGTAESDLEHLNFDPRQPELGEYLNQPDHNLAHSANDPSGAGCTTCHDPEPAHDFLPYVERHVEALACETCHTPLLVASARQSIDWTVVTAEGAPGGTCRGEEVNASSGQTLLTGYEPVLIKDADGRIAPYNLIASWYWVSGAEDEPISLADVRAAYLDGNTYAAEVLAAFDDDSSSTLDESELIVNTTNKEAVIAGRLSNLGYTDPHIVGEVQSYPVNHGVVKGEYATRDCETCHEEETALTMPISLGGSTPGGVVPAFPDGDPAANGGSFDSGPDGTLYYQPNFNASQPNRYIFGVSRVRVIDWIGALIFISTILAVVGHGGLRFFATRRNGKHLPALEEHYMYSMYERLWHWLQTATIGILLFTGLIIHRPDMFGIFSFRGVVLVHNVVAVILLINAALAAFYHFSSGQIQQFLPHPHGLFDQLFRQARFYLDGIFRHEPHPFEKTPARKMNPLQQITYLGLLNVLLPLQIITGILMWGVERWPGAASLLGGLPLLAPVHTLVAWLFASFIVAHVYLTTTGPTPLTSLKGMIMGWEEVEAQPVAGK